MKRKSIIIICLFLFIVLLATTVNATDEACKISLSADKTTLEQGDTVTINVLMSNVTKTDGISQYYGMLEYSEDIFEIILDDDTSIKADYEEYTDYSILYSGRQDSDNTIKNPWYMILVKQEDKNGFVASVDTKFSSTVQPVKSGESQITGKIKLKVKSNVTGTTAKISLKNMKVFGADSTNDSTTDTSNRDTISDASINLTIKEQTKDGITSIKNIEENKNKQIENKNQNANIASNEAPYTGIEDTIPVIFILAIIALFAYVNYKKYKNI